MPRLRHGGIKMKQNRKFWHFRTAWLPILVGVLAVGGLLVGAQAASAVDNGPTISPSACMQRIAIGPTGNVTNADKLNCTANDIRISRAISVSPATCVAGGHFTLTGTFETIVTANARYDAGFFFRTDGGTNARGDGTTASGTCSLSTLTPGVSPSLNLDGDTCGDLNAGTYNLTFTIPDVLCQDPDGDGFLNLPNCTSWHSNQGTVCNITNQFTFQPDTKSKCVCDDTFQVPVIVETASLTVVKSASPTSVPETGGTVTYTVQVTNDAAFVSVTIGSIIDDLYGDLSTLCPSLIGDVLAPGDSTSCTFQAFVSGNSGDTVTDTVEVCGTDSAGHPNICGHDDADVNITDVFTEPTLAKTAQSAANCQLDVTYQVVVSNNSPTPHGDTLTVNSLNDNKFGDITTAHAAGGGFEEVVTPCSLPPSPIAAGGNFTCTFVGRITSTTCTFTHTDNVTGQETDSDGHTFTQSDPDGGASVSVSTTIP
jgi:hypothetical protein